MRKLSLIILFLNFSIPCFATALTLQQGADSYSGVSDTHLYKADGGDSNENTSVILKAATQYAAYEFRVVIKFDVSSIPAGSTINSATLYLYRSSDQGTSVVTGVHRVFKAWTNTGATWNDWINPNSEWGAGGAENASDAGTDNSGDGSDYDRTTTPLDTYSYTVWAAAGWWDWDVTTAVQNWVDETWANNGLSLKVSSGEINDQQGFHSSEYLTDTTKRPKLVIDYTPPSNRRIIIVD